MKETKQDKIWELTASRVHHEGDKNETGELEQLLQQSENQKIIDDSRKIQSDLQSTAPLYKTSEPRSWLNISDYFRKKKIRFFLSVSKYAAIIVLALISGILINHYRNTPVARPLTYSEVKVPLGQMAEMTLSDGTHVWLNSGTTLRYADNFGNEAREVKLDGEAFFKVKKDEIPFKVELKGSEIEVLGTSFAAISYREDNFSKVTLVEGSVKVNKTTGEEITRLTPRDQIHIPESPKEYFVKKVDTRFYESWTEGKIEFDDEKLSDVARRLERWYNVEIHFEQEEIGELRFSGTILKNKPFNQITRAFCLLLPVEVNYQNNIENKDVIIISKK
ncbi:FecR family protein [Tangfeifania diversioriginum]|uniref:FecR family protein n=1 Tax=Tangfeifania diversioriginum TaxID=1168035 RepID=A0A1M6E3K6_9BACT|nr:FecR domain-containing protein [Tangfeifania diversioriginum]SHI80076.1 FecR family protein [Tangfeifania diversioriginum]